jgi:hypothetical protein
MIWRSPLTTARRSEQLRDAVISAWHCPSSDSETAPRGGCTAPIAPVPHIEEPGGTEKRSRQGVGFMQDKDRCHPSPRPHMTSTQTGGCSRVPRRPPKGGVCGGQTTAPTWASRARCSWVSSTPPVCVKVTAGRSSSRSNRFRHHSRHHHRWMRRDLRFASSRNCSGLLR